MGGNTGTGGVIGTGNVGADSPYPKGIGADWTWTSGVVPHVAGPYAPCGILGPGPVTFGAANPTAPEIAVASRSGVVFFYSSDTGQQSRTPFYAAGPVSGVTYSRDGTQLVVAGDTGVQIIRLADGKELSRFHPFTSFATAAALSPDGSLMAAAGWDLPPGFSSEVVTLRLVRVSDGTPIADHPVGGQDSMHGVPPQFSLDGKLLTIDSQIFSVPDLQLGPSAGFFYNVLSPDGTKVVQDGHVVDLATGQDLKEVQDGYMGSAFSPDGATYAECFGDVTGPNIQLWRTSDWTAIGTPTSISYSTQRDGAVTGRIFFSGDGTRLISMLSGEDDGGDRLVLQVINVPDLTRRAVVAGPVFGWGRMALSPDGSLVAAQANVNGGVWRTADLSAVSRVIDATQGGYAFLGNGMLDVWPYSMYDPLTGTKLGDALGSAISADGRLGLFSLVSYRWVVARLSDLTTQALLDSAVPYGPWVFSSDKRFVASVPTFASGGTQVRVFDATTGATVGTVDGATSPLAITTTPSGGVRVAAFVPDPSFPSIVRVWSVPDGKPRFDIDQVPAKNFPPLADVPPMAFSPDGSLIAAGGQGGIRIFEAETGALRQTLPAHTDPLSPNPYTGVLSLAFSPNGQMVSIGWDTTMRFWCSP